MGDLVLPRRGRHRAVHRSARAVSAGLLVFVTLLGARCEEPRNAGDTPATEVAQSSNTLTPSEIDEGWRLLFDGKSLDGWRGYNRTGVPAQWHVDRGTLAVIATAAEEAGSGGDLVTTEAFSDFELRLDFNVGPVGNSGIFYRVVERDGDPIWANAPEFQVLDDTAYVEMGTMDMHKHLTGDNYDLHASAVVVSNPIGEWNSVRIVVDGDSVEHWLNGQQTVAYTLWSPEWEELVAASKFSAHPEYGRAISGPIGLQETGTLVRYRNIKIRPL